MNVKFPHKKTESLVYILLWLIILIISAFADQLIDDFSWQAAAYNIILYTPFLLAFIINNTLLAPKLLFKKRYQAYFSFAFLLALSVSHPIMTKPLHQLVLTNNILADGSQQPGFFQPPMPPEEAHQQTDSQPTQHFMPLNSGIPPQVFHGMKKKMHHRRILARFGLNFLIVFLVIGSNTSIKQAIKLMNEERMRHELQEDKLKAELTFLKHQISPHFLMNTLNCIHGLVDIDKKYAQNSIISLAHMLKYMLYEKEDKQTSLTNEIVFIRGYVDLMKMRYSDKLDVQINVPEHLPSIYLPPFVFITVIENAFKHGASPGKSGFIHINIDTKDKQLVFSCINSKLDSIPESKDEQRGIGLVNTRKRLDIYFNKNYSWEVIDTDNKYLSTIKLPLAIKN